MTTNATTANRQPAAEKAASDKEPKPAVISIKDQRAFLKNLDRIANGECRAQ